ncbi:ead/Ea22-like family protein [Escherichia coli]|uniref:ead/Ea22-like family protein n=1 Tax=Escherichia coli TaxID=562 RepID=UPI000446734D|nr:ead/Ea22-like family protein [Escherichia coli]EYE15232.1 ead/Ea22-like family protein [Escherichia coli 1-110-08_S3_C3]EYE25289.1 ead/Ea22-like family protein [Escherichia coli 1-110-08_S3_C1]EYE30043.1 ead/Ea22-like family protein [Escherichia coli 1-110-08_S3_C2]HAH9926267.1 ead/Ea22-like family protein [Escherichia coli]
MSKIDYHALREAAEKATKGKWAVEFDDEIYSTDGINHEQIAMVLSENESRDAEFIAAANPATVLALLDERERNQQYIKRRDQENEDIALTVGKLRVELEAEQKTSAARLEALDRTHKMFQREQCRAEAAEKRIAELESGSQAQKLVEAIIVAIENEQERLFDEDYLMDSKECIDVIREEVKRWNDSRAAGIRIKGE